MNFYTNRGSTPKLKMKLVNDSNLDHKLFNSLLSDCTITFSMLNSDTNTYRIANKSGEIERKGIDITDVDTFTEYLIVYQFTEHDTAKTGSYIGEFQIVTFENGIPCQTLIVPVKERLNVYIQDSITKTTKIRI